MSNQNIPEDVMLKVNNWLASPINENDKNKIKNLLSSDQKELIDSFYTDLEFGTGGLRGIMGIGPNRMNEYTVGMATQGLANYLQKCFPSSGISVCIAYDCRNHSRFFAQTAAKVLAANNFKVFLFDQLRPTPELSFAVRELKANAGIVITASHNPKEYNGYKVYWNDGGQLVPPHDKNVISEVRQISSFAMVKTDDRPENIKIVGKEIDEKYLSALQKISLLNNDTSISKDIKIVYTPLHGTGVTLMPKALEAFGFKNIIHVPEQDINDGNFPTVHSPNPEEQSALNMAIEKAVESDADIVLATDPDADRVGMAVKTGKGIYELLNGNQTAALLTWLNLEMRAKQNSLPSNAYIVKTIVTSDLLRIIADEYKVKTFNVLTGFKYIAEVIRQNEGQATFICGGEESYGFLSSDVVRDKDALMTACQLAELTAIAKSKGKNLFDLMNDIYRDFAYYFESQVSITKKGKDGLAEIKQMMEKFRKNPPTEIAGVSVKCIYDYKLSEAIAKDGKKSRIELPTSDVLQFLLTDQSLITVRPSGTEPKIKFYFSVTCAKTEEESQIVIDSLKEKIKKFEEVTRI